MPIQRERSRTFHSYLILTCKRYHNFMQFMGSWQQSIKNNTAVDANDRPPPIAVFRDNCDSTRELGWPKQHDERLDHLWKNDHKCFNGRTSCWYSERIYSWSEQFASDCGVRRMKLLHDRHIRKTDSSRRRIPSWWFRRRRSCLSLTCFAQMLPRKNWNQWYTGIRHSSTKARLH